MSDWITHYPIGATAEFIKTFTENDVKLYAGLSGDNNPVHLDEEYASGTQFQKRIVHGMLVASMFSTIFGTDFPGEGAIYLGQTLKFKAPVYLGETITAQVTVSSVRDDKPIGTFKTVAVNEKGQAVIEGEATLLLP